MHSLVSYLNFAASYVKHKIFAKSPKGHGVHSPFAYDFICNVLGGARNIEQIESLKNQRKEIVGIHEKIPLSSFGAKDKCFDGSVTARKVIKSSSVSHKRGALLYHAARWLGARNILEIGTSLGISALYLAKACPFANIITLEGEKSRVHFAKNLFEKNGVSNIKIIEGVFEETLSQALNLFDSLDLVFFDGNHSYEATLNYFEQCLKKRSHKSIFIFDDIRWSPQMLKAWEQISNHKTVSVSIDLFHTGIVLFNKGVIKQKYMINF